MQHTITFYNVENLYDVFNNKKIRDIEYTFSGKRSWNKTRYLNKLQRIAKTINLIGRQETHNSPTFIGLCEIENKKVIEDLLDYLPGGENYEYIHQDSLDKRGIDTAFFYNKKYFSLLTYDFIRIPVFNSDGIQDFTRDITYVQGKLGEIQIHFFVLHLPSKKECDINKPKRIYILHKLREKIDSIYKIDSMANIIIMGDFNENPGVPYIDQELKCSKTIDNLSLNELFNPFEELHKKNKFSTVYKGKGMLFDQIIFSQSFFSNKRKNLYITSKIFNVPFLQDTERRKIGIPFRTYSGSRYLGGYSDHFPVYSLLEINKDLGCSF